MRWTLATLLLAGCAQEQSATWLEGFGYEWVLFNHRLSYLEVGVEEAEARMAVIGGTSTTGVRPELDEACDPDACREFPALDSSDAYVRWGRVNTRKATVGTGSATLLAGADGAETSLTIELPQRRRGEVTPLIQGLSIDTDAALSGTEAACYDPANGWLPRRLAVSIDTADLAEDGRSVTLGISAAFEAGATLEDYRACIDEVLDRAQVAVTVDVVVLVGKGDIERREVVWSDAWDLGESGFQPDEQPDPETADRSLTFDLEDPVLGWRTVDFRFHQQIETDRGAYIRSLDLIADSTSGFVSGHATNYSPPTQLSGFDYLFRGVVQAVDVGAEVEHGEVLIEGLSTDVDEQGRPVITREAF